MARGAERHQRYASLRHLRNQTSISVPFRYRETSEWTSATGARHLNAKLRAALVIVLAFVVLLAGVVTAYLARTTSDRQVAHGSFNQIKADQLARSALSIVIGDLKQEIANGSTSTTVNHSLFTLRQGRRTFCRSAADGGSPDPIPNLVRRSLRSDPVAPPGVGSRASALSSAPLPSSSPATTKKGGNQR